MTVTVHSGRRPTTPYEKLRSKLAAQAIARGEIKVPIRCSWCRSESIDFDRSKDAERDPDGGPLMICVSCGRSTTKATARTLRRQEMRAIIAAGIDPPGLR